jgi:type VI secretion system protein ImpA
MPSPEVLNFAKLLAPIPGDKPTGVDLRTDPSPNSPYYVIKDARSAARAIERASYEDPANAPVPDWKPVVQQGSKVLGEKSKDLEITAYMIEALLRLNSFGGLRDGFRLARELCEKFWDGIYPLPDEEGLETRVAALTGLNGEGGDGTLMVPINRTPLTDSPNLGRLSYASYLEAGTVGKIADPKVREKRLAAGAMSMEKFEKAVAETPKAFYTTLVDDLNKSLEELDKLGKELDKRCANNAPPTSAIKDVLGVVLGVVKDVAKSKLEAPPTADGAAVKPDAAAGAALAGSAPAAAAQRGEAVGELGNREDALRILLKVADFFRRTEPHNPVSYALEQAARWAKMPLPDLLVELIPDEAPRKGLFKQVGIKPPEPPPKK